jgi:predicted metal-dependent hydrolase
MITETRLTPRSRTRTSELTIGGIGVSVVRKAIKNLHLGVYPPDGRVRVAAPLQVSNAAVRVAVIGKLAWIRRQREAFAQQARQSEPEMVDGESHYFLGRRYRLAFVEVHGKGGVELRSRSILELRARRALSAEQRERVLQTWYRQRLKELAEPLIAQWQSTLGVPLQAWCIRRMKTKWGSCNTESRRILLNLELAKKSPECLEYIVVHELVHLLVRHHDERFQALMDRHLPRWRSIRRVLNAAPLAHETWQS